MVDVPDAFGRIFGFDHAEETWTIGGAEPTKDKDRADALHVAQAEKIDANAGK